jgi:type I restriction enzyme S subunit
MLPAGSVVFSSRAPIGLLAFAQNALCTNQGFKSVIPYDLSMNKWIFYALMNMTESIMGRASGTTFLEVSGEFMRKEVCPLPSLAEQHRIVAKVDELMALCDELKTARDVSFAYTASNVVPFPGQEEDDEMLAAARGDGAQGLSNKAQHDADELFGD